MVDKKDFHKIELRSEVVREIMGNPPSFLVRSSISIIFIIILSIIIGSCFFKYPDTIQAPFIIEKNSNVDKEPVFVCKIKIPITGIGKIKINQTVCLKLIQYSYVEFGQLNCKINNIILQPMIENQLTYYSASSIIGTKLKTNTLHEIEYIEGLAGTAEIIIDNKPLIYKLIQPLKILFN